MQEYYKILGISENASIEEINDAYNRLKSQYSKDRFLEGEAGNEAAKKLTKLETAYSEIMNNINDSKDYNDANPSFDAIEKLIREGRLNEAQDLLDKFSTRSAEWHYIQSVVFYKKNWNNESLKQLEIALNMEPSNSKYSIEYSKLRNKVDADARAFRSGNAGYGADGNPETNRQMGGTNDCMTFCATWCCMDMLCSMCCN